MFIFSHSVYSGILWMASSEYLHFFGRDRLLGIGMEADAETGSTQGMKLSMFDISTPENNAFVDISGQSWIQFLDYVLAELKKQIASRASGNKE